MKWLFGLEEVGSKFIVKDFLADDQSLNYVGKQVISILGFEIKETAPDYLEILLEKFGGSFPKTIEFSDFARSTVADTSPIEEPDKTLISWLEQEELLFKTLESHIVSKKLEAGFGENGIDVDEFIGYSLSVHNRRKSRAGHSFEHHLSCIFQSNEVLYSRGQKTERNNRPDFIFPDISNYRDSEFSTNLLTMLGVKTTAKDRWRQVLAEAERISHKHLITLEPAISLNQTDEMQKQNLQLVIPETIMESYTSSQQDSLISLAEFIELVKERQQ